MRSNFLCVPVRNEGMTRLVSRNLCKPKHILKFCGDWPILINVRALKANTQTNFRLSNLILFKLKHYELVLLLTNVYMYRYQNEAFKK